ncbi:MAG: hypothetical protein P4M07_21870 [Xanthobacteraceae bacterium]|nr:hypothetical protein [Xanthobacteraceae bacterium]
MIAISARADSTGRSTLKACSTAIPRAKALPPGRSGWAGIGAIWLSWLISSHTLELFITINGKDRKKSRRKSHFLRYSYLGRQVECLARLTEGHRALPTIPLTVAQRRGEPVRFLAHALVGSRAQVTIHIHGGRDVVPWTPRNEARTGLALKCRGVDRLGGAALALFWIPDAASASHLRLSGDRRNLGLLIDRA